MPTIEKASIMSSWLNILNDTLTTEFIFCSVNEGYLRKIITNEFE
jgi:hypothetical protein